MRRFNTIQKTAIAVVLGTIFAGNVAFSQEAVTPSEEHQLQENVQKSTVVSIQEKVTLKETSDIHTMIPGEAVEYAVFNPGEIMGNSSVVIAKDGKAMLVDAGFSKADGERIVKFLQENNLELTTVFISHGDPDYYFGLPAVLAAYPEAKSFATKETIKHIEKTYEDKLDVWAPLLQENAPNKEAIILPERIKNAVEFEDQTFEIVGKDKHRTSLFNKEDGLLLGGITVSADSHVFIADTPKISDQKSWIKDLEKLESLEPKIVIPGHFGSDNNFGIDNIQFTKRYIETFIEAEETANSSQEIVEMMQAAYPDFEDSVESVLELSAKVVTGEIEWD